MSVFELRPRFRKNTNLSAKQISESVKTLMHSADPPCTATIATNHIVLGIPPEQQHYWSPQLNIEIDEQENGCLLRCLFGPSPNVWTMFMFFYTGVAFTGLIGLFYGLSQWTLNMAPWALLVVPFALIGEIVLYTISKAGQKLAGEQMDFLHTCLNNLLQSNVNKKIL